jgi:hypothetical protein
VGRALGRRSHGRAPENKSLIFYLGTHEPSWLARARVPLFISRRRLARQKNWPRALSRWALDSGGFSELSMFGAWQTSARQYAAEATGWRAQIGRMDWAAVQDWMCEPFILAKTRRTIAQHQAATLRSLRQLEQLAPDVTWLPVLQGWTRDDYERHADAYERAGIDLAARPIVGIGSICRRQGTREAAEIVRAMARRGLAIHVFGFKTLGLISVRNDVISADSMAWSYQARKRSRMDGCTHHLCSNCLAYALRWRGELRRSCRIG